MEIIVTVLYIAICVALFALAIIVHEFGHFIVALKLGLRVEAFSVGFGPVLWKKRVNGVEYRLSAIPLGGYVSIPDVDPEGTKALEGSSSANRRRQGYGGQEAAEDKGIEEAGAAAAKLPAWKEIAVAVAGPLMNVVLAVVLAVVLSLVPSAKFGELLAEIGSVVEDGPAAEGIAHGGEHACRLVHHDRARPLRRRADGPAVHRDLSGGRVEPRARLAHYRAVHRHAPFLDHRRRAAPARDAAVREYVLKPLVHGAIITQSDCGGEGGGVI